MATSIRMPQLGESVAEGTIARWLKAEGQTIARDEPLVEIITDKVNAEIPSPVAGVLRRIVAAEGAVVAVGEEIAIVEEAPAEAPSPAAPEAGAERYREGPSVGPTGVSAAETGEAAETEAAEGEARRRYSPLVRQLAQEHHIDLGQVRGTGSGGRVTRDDVLAYLAARQQAAAPAAPSPPPAEPPPAPAPAAPPLAAAAAEPGARPGPPAPAEGDEVVPLSPIRRAIAEHMVRSVHTSPHAWMLVEVDATGLVRWREAELAEFRRREGFELTYLPFVLKAVVEALRHHPALNACWADDRIILRRAINVGIAVALEDGLVVPVVHHADRLSIAGLARAVHDLVSRARAGKLTLADVQGGTFTLNNTGVFGSIASQPILNQPQAAILTMEAIVKRPVVIDDAIAIRSIMNLCLSFDHRVLDGATAGRFLAEVKRRIESLSPADSLY